MNYIECLHKFVNAHSDNILQSLYAVVESSQIECLECPIEKTSTDNFLIKIYIHNIIHNIRTLLLTCLSGSVGNLLHNTEIEEKEKCFFLTDDKDDADNGGDTDNVTHQHMTYSTDRLNTEDNSDFLSKCKQVHKIRKSLKNAQIKKNSAIHMRSSILDYYI
ncbi:hypothetical protein POVWA2_043340 [Plasmodium ovale wallikeri]|uniref:Uncharacterized protein n=2 Tax=Plasmodium ovale TaxID=36330 RepID=A0A1A8ZD48_PLAOA|nr:hypothetical protein POVWA1_044750 [Plasmodium ovale wallikeri]SBT42169.1 hypothetical protein POVWA2_043340 [Plasmodium ovale wallikeri]SBT78245.1 conserved Plasmodium protein, unknown function [Plasmodium ovale]